MTDDAAHSAEPWRCPKCRAVLQVERLVIEDEDGHDEVVCFDCPTGDYHRAVTAKQGAEMMIPPVMERLKQELYASPR